MPLHAALIGNLTGRITGNSMTPGFSIQKEKAVGKPNVAAGGNGSFPT